MKDKFGIYGASGHAKVIIEMLENNGVDIQGLYDDDPSKKLLLDYRVTHDRLFLQYEGIKWVIGIGENSVRKKIVENNLLGYGVIIDKTAYVSKRAVIGEGSVVMPGVSVNSTSIIGKHAIVNTNASIDHDCVVEDYVHISPNAVLCGGVKIGEGSHVGAGATIIPGITIGKWCTIGAGSVIIRDVGDSMKVVGNPGRIINN
ncbi:MAG: acetyltransferase [Ginsengibacter sp.]